MNATTLAVDGKMLSQSNAQNPRTLAHCWRKITKDFVLCLGKGILREQRLKGLRLPGSRACWSPAKNYNASKPPA
jgi:hypothetical protein